MSTPTFKELLEGATPVECPDCRAALEKWWAVERRMSARGNFGIVPAPMNCKKHLGRNQQIEWCRKKLAARLSPEVMRVVLEALNTAHKRMRYDGKSPAEHAKFHQDVSLVESARALLNGDKP